MTQPQQDENKPYTTRPRTQTDLEERSERDFLPVKTSVDPNATNAPYKVEGNDTSAYVGVDADKMNYANDTEKPIKATEGVEVEQSEALLSGYAYGEDPKAEGKQTVGSGSSQPVLTVTSSGENVTHKSVDRKALQEKLKDVAKEAKDGKSPEPLRSTEDAGVVKDGEGKSADEASAPSTGQKPARNQQPKPPAAE